MNQTDLFGDAPRIHIEGNPLLEGIANHILDLVQRDGSLLDGESVGIIDRKLTIAVWRDNGLEAAVHSGQWERFQEWAMNPKLCIDQEVISRARRYLEERDAIRLPQKAIVIAEQHRQRIARSVKR